MRRGKGQKVIRRIADKTRMAGKGRNIIAVIAIAMTSLLFTSLFTIGGNMIVKQQEGTMRQVGGSSHAGIKYLTQEEYDIVRRDEKLKEVSYRICVGDAVNDSLNKLHTEISYYEDLDAKMSFCYPEEGHMPQREDEIVTSDLVLDALGISCELGQKVPLVINIDGEIQEKTFTLCGYFKGDTVASAQVAAVSKEYANKVAPTPTASALKTGTSNGDYAGRIMADFNFDSSWQLEKQAQSLLERCGFPEETPVGINWAYMGGEMDIETIVLMVVLLLIILASGYLIIYNIFYINVFHDIRHYGLLKTIGTTGKQLRKIVRRQAYVLSLYGIPIGLIGGVLVGKLLLPMVMGEFNFSRTADSHLELNPWIFIGSAVFSFLTVYISCIKPCKIASKVTAVEAVRYTEGQDVTDRKRKKATHSKKVSPRHIALRNIGRNRKKVVVVVASLSLALVILNSISSLVSGFDMDKFISSMTVSDFSVSDATLDNVSVDLMNRVYDGVTADFLQELEKKDGVEAIGNIYINQLGIIFSEEDFAKVEENIFNNPQEKERLEAMEAEMGELLNSYKQQRYLDGNIYGMGKLAVEKLENVDGDLDWEKFQTGKYVIATRFGFSDEEDECAAFFHPGETVTLTNETGESREYEVLAVVDIPYSCGLQVFGIFNCDFILPEQEYLDFMGQQQPMRTIFNVEKDKEETVQLWLENYCGTVNPDLTYTSKESIVQEFDSMKDMVVMVGGLLSLILAIIGILNFINTMVTSIISRRQEFAMMEAVGMTGTQQRQVLLWEGVYYALLTGIVSLLLAALLNITAIRSIGEGFFFFTWHFTITSVLACLPFLAAAVFIVPTVCYKNMCQVSVVERMRRAE